MPVGVFTWENGLEKGGGGEGLPDTLCKLYMLIISTFLSNYCNMLFS